MPGAPGPLARFLPPLPEGVARSWLSENVPPGAWILDPFGASPRLAAEIAQSGYRLLVTANNPIERFLLELAAAPPAREELRAALADLAASSRAGERIEHHIRGLYRTECDQCGQMVEAEAFIWDRNASDRSLRIYTCPYCKDSGEHPITPADQENLAQYANNKLQRARALERVAPLEDPDRVHVEEALEVYPDRAVYALLTLVNKLDNLPPARQRLVEALLLAAFDQANTLWSHPTTRARPKQLTDPTRFREKNIWLAVEEAVEQWSALREGSEDVPLTYWPNPPPASGGICLYQGRLKELVEQVHQAPSKDFEISAVVAALPRPNQAYWTLSALWSGWLWGNEAVVPFKSALRRRRYDWAWHTTALQAAYRHLIEMLNPGTPFFGLIGEAEGSYLAAALLAAETTSFDLVGVAIRPEKGRAQLQWKLGVRNAQSKGTPLPVAPHHIQEVAQHAVRDHLLKCREPADVLHLQSAALSAMVRELHLVTTPSFSPADLFSQIQEAIQSALANRGLFTRYGGSERNPESGLWWLRDDREVMDVSLSDQIEMAIVRYLQQHPGCTLEEIDAFLCPQFPGLFTPDLDLIQACLRSYGEVLQPGSSQWNLRPQDSPKTRRHDLAEMRHLLNKIGRELGYEVVISGQEKPPNQPAPPQYILWCEASRVHYVFYALASAVMSKIIFAPKDAGYKRPQRLPDEPPRQILVVPGGRAGLIGFKLAANPRLRAEVDDHWRLVKFRHLRRLAENASPGRGNFDAQLASDPLANNDPQMVLL